MSGAYVGGFPEGGFQRVRDNVGSSYAAELKRENQLAEERERQKQLEQDRRDAFRAEENEKRRAANEAKAVQAFRDFHDPRKRGEITANVMKYTEARGYRRENYRIANAELLDPEFIKYFYPEKYAQMERVKADAATLTPNVYCDKCGCPTNLGYLGTCFQVGKQYGTLTVTEINGDSCTAKCQCGREGVATRRDIEDGTTVCMVCEEKER